MNDIELADGVAPAVSDFETDRASLAGAAAPLAIAASLALAACDTGSSTGGGGGPIGGTPTPTPTPTPAPIGQVQASRFLAQATMGATKAEIANVQSLGYDGWLNQQMAMPRAISHWDWLVGAGYNVPANINSETGFDVTMWRQLISEPDQLRQRVGMALLELMVVGIGGVNLNWKQFAMAAYVDLLLDNAFGNFRTILDKITTNAAMASFLTFLGNRKANTATGSVPDENYARELMQLFALGLYKLNMDGSRVMSGGTSVETYTQADVSQLARVFTGLTTDTNDGTTPDRYRRALIVNSGQHENGASSFLGATVPAGTAGLDAIKIALDTIFAHQNVAPFVSRQLIQKLVTSNPSPAYVGRVSAAFADNGAGVRGDMKAVIKAVLLDTEARGDAALTGTSAGKLREPVMRFTNWARAFGATSPSNAWAIGDTSSPTTRLSQSMGRSNSVFNFFRPGYTPPNTAIATAGMVAPELQLSNEPSVVAYINYMKAIVENGTGDVKGNYTEIATRASDAQSLVDEVNLLLAGGQLSSATVTSIRGAVESIATTATNATNNRVYLAVLLTLAAPDYLTLR